MKRNKEQPIWLQSTTAIVAFSMSLIQFNQQIPSLITPAFGQVGPFHVIPLIVSLSIVSVISWALIEFKALSKWIPSPTKLANVSCIFISSSIIYSSLVMRHAETMGGATLGPQIVYAGTIYSVTFLLNLAILQETKLVFKSTSKAFYLIGGIAYLICLNVLITNGPNCANLLRSQFNVCKCHVVLLSPIPLIASQIYRGKRQKQQFNLVFTMLIYFVMAFASIQLYLMCGASPTVGKVRPAPIGNSPYSLYDQGESVTGWISVIRDSNYQARLLRSDM